MNLKFYFILKFIFCSKIFLLGVINGILLNLEKKDSKFNIIYILLFLWVYFI